MVKTDNRCQEIGTSRTPSPTVKLKNIGETGRLHLVTSACFARTPSPTVKSKKCRLISSDSISSEESAGKRNLSDNIYNDACF